MMKPTDSLQVESEKTDKISQQMESDATPLSLNRSVSFEIVHAVTHDNDHVADQYAEDDEDQGQVMGNVQESIAAGRA